jgi:hypothetical protein
MTRKQPAKQMAPHWMVPGFLPGWFVCSCGCGYVAVCRHCVPTALSSVPQIRCDAELRRLRLGPYAKQEYGSVASDV